MPRDEHLRPQGFASQDGISAVGRKRFAVQQDVQKDVRVEEYPRPTSGFQTVLRRIVLHADVIGGFAPGVPHTAPRTAHPRASPARSGHRRARRKAGLKPPQQALLVRGGQGRHGVFDLGERAHAPENAKRRHHRQRIISPATAAQAITAMHGDGSPHALLRGEEAGGTIFAVNAGMRITVKIISASPGGILTVIAVNGSPAVIQHHRSRRCRPRQRPGR